MKEEAEKAWLADRCAAGIGVVSDVDGIVRIVTSVVETVGADESDATVVVAVVDVDGVLSFVDVFIPRFVLVAAVRRQTDGCDCVINSTVATARRPKTEEKKNDAKFRKKEK